LFLKGAEIASAVEAEAEHGIEDRGSIEGEKLTARARRVGAVVVATLGQRVAGGAGSDVAARETDVVEQPLAEPNLVAVQVDEWA
jgi:hypothetical protein